MYVHQNLFYQSLLECFLDILTNLIKSIKQSNGLFMEKSKKVELIRLYTYLYLFSEDLFIYSKRFYLFVLI